MKKYVYDLYQNDFLAFLTREDVPIPMTVRDTDLSACDDERVDSVLQYTIRRKQ